MKSKKYQNSQYDKIETNPTYREDKCIIPQIKIENKTSNYSVFSFKISFDGDIIKKAIKLLSFLHF